MTDMIPPLGVALVGVAMIAVGAFMGRSRLRLMTHGIICDARITAWRVHKELGEHDQYLAQLAYTDCRAKAQQVELNHLFSDRTPPVGSSLTIVYSRDQPDKPRYYAVKSMIVQPLVPIVFGLFCIALPIWKALYR